MSNQILLNFAVPFTEILAAGDVDTSYLRKAAVVVKPKEGVTPAITEVYDAKGLAAITGNTEALGFFGADLNRVFVISLAAADLSDLDDVLKANENKFFTLHVSSDFDDSVVLNKTFNFDGVVSHEFASSEGAKQFAVNHCAGVSTLPTVGSGICYALGRLLSLRTFWGNQQYVDYGGGASIETVSILGLAEKYFDERLTFWLFDEDGGTKLAGFFDGGNAITEKYVSEELKLAIQSNAVRYISTNQPMNIRDMRVALQNELQANVNQYVDDNYLDPDGTNKIVVTDSRDAYWVNGTLNVKHAQPIWRMSVTAIKE